jgi:5-methylcytosine-specific restriction endonuclease McrA
MAYKGALNSRRRRQLRKKLPPICAHCGARQIDGVKLTIDHIVPASRGGSNAMWNLQLLCEPCNQEKADRLPRELRIGWRSSA